MTNATASVLKYLSIKLSIFGPKRQIKPPTRKKRADLEAADAIRKIGKSIRKAPAEIVKTLYGIGVKPAIPTAQAS